MSRTRYVGRHRTIQAEEQQVKNNTASKTVRRVIAPLFSAAAIIAVVGNSAFAADVPVSPGDTFSGLVATYCGTNDWQDVALPGRDKNLIYAGETLHFDCPGQTSNADVAAQNTPAPPAPVQNTPVSCNGPATPHWWNDTQWGNARIIVQTGLDLGFSKTAIIIALMTAMQESTLHNYANPYYPSSYNYPNDGSGYDHDSLGLFQQRSSTGWGSVQDIMNPWYAASQFFIHLGYFDWWNYSLSGAAQHVQVSAYPSAYAKWESDATNMADAILCS